MSLEQQAEERKKRLGRLRSMKRGSSAVEEDVEIAPSEDSKGSAADHLDVRETIEAIPTTAQDLNSKKEETVEETAEKFGDDTVQKLQASTADDVTLDLEHLRPQDELADFKRYLQPKLDKLEELTNEAIYKSVKERLKNLEPAD